MSTDLFQQTPSEANSDIYDNDGGITSQPVDRSQTIAPNQGIYKTKYFSLMEKIL